MRTKRLRVLLAAVASVVALTPQSASAHPTEWSTNWRAWGEFGFCVEAHVNQEHAWHFVSTLSTNCSNARNSWHTQNQEFYKVPMGGGAGTFCFEEGWHQSVDGDSPVYQRFYGYDPGHWCNWGGIHHWITVDSWQYSWKNDWEGYKGGARRPATWHCHCP